MKTREIVRIGMIVVAMVASLGLISDAMAATMSGSAGQQKKAVTTAPAAPASPRVTPAATSAGVPSLQKAADKRDCPDLTFQGSIGFVLKEKTPSGNWAVAIKGTVKNDGKLNYQPGNTADAVLYMGPPDTLNGGTRLPSIGVGQSAEVQAVVIWLERYASSTWHMYLRVHSTTETNRASLDCNLTNNRSGDLNGQLIQTEILKRE